MVEEEIVAFKISIRETFIKKVTFEKRSEVDVVSVHVNIQGGKSSIFRGLRLKDTWRFVCHGKSKVRKGEVTARSKWTGGHAHKPL